MFRQTTSPRMRNIEGELRTSWLGHPTLVLDQVDSTNQYVKLARLEKRARHGAVVWADQQTAGRGRLGRAWDSPSGQHLYLSLLLEPPKTHLTGLVSLLSGVAVTKTVRSITGLDARIKWPNDGVVQGKKFCGILVEAGRTPDPWCVVGIGINVLGDEITAMPHATTLQHFSTRALSREELFVALLSSFEMAYESWLKMGNTWVTEEWTQYSATLGQWVKVIRPGENNLIGLAEAIDTDGGLFVRSGDSLHKVVAGEVSVRMADGRYAPDKF